VVFLGNMQGKVWGKTEKIFDNGLVEIHRIEANAGGFSSRHRHHSKWNMFYIESGKLAVEIYRENGLRDRTIISDGQQTSVPPREWHRFEALSNTIAYEVYWSELISDDIEREDHGGMFETETFVSEIVNGRKKEAE